MLRLLILSVSCLSALGQFCEDFQEGACPLDEYTIIHQDHNTGSPGLCQDLCRVEETGRCRFFTHFQTTCFLLKSCDYITICQGCASGPLSPDFDTCPWPPVPGSTTQPPPPTTTTPTTTPRPTTTTTTTPRPTTTTTTTPLQTTTSTTTAAVDCGHFFPGYLCHSHENVIDHIMFIYSPAECQAICQERDQCQYFSHYLEEKGDHIGHCYLHWDCYWLDEAQCRNNAARSCPYIPSAADNDSSAEGDFNDAREELDPEEDDPTMEKDDIELQGSHSGECGCIAGPKYPDIDFCDVHPLVL